ncbi:hypothetical protein [Lachnoclostridium sp. Marseille-P6806]|uniref:hypothetical protein n=1 Tax=Lachnoclostridium sp. Marseille-P6806 TaxID=2364793 RepID=UPI00102FE460|nr:hypothetical protein [Lachnoclostridium sp. Marseille-P6806]
MSSIIRENQFFDNEMDFCRVRNGEAKQRVENLFLKNGISYFVKWEERPFLDRLFRRDGEETVILRINTRDYAKALGLVEHLDSVKILSGEPAHDWSPKEELRLRKEGSFLIREENGGEPDAEDGPLAESEASADDEPDADYFR